MDSTDYLNQNELRKYPFVDDAVLTTVGGIALTNAFLVDIALYPTIPDVRIKLVQIVKTGTQLRLTFSNGTTTYDSVSFAKIELTTLPFSITGLSGWCVFNSGMTSLVNGTHTLNAYILDSRVFPYSPMVTSINLENVDVALLSTSTELTLKAGSNIQLAENELSVQPAAGTGLYDACANEPGIKTIKQVNTSDGNFIFGTDACQQLTKSEAHTLLIENLCQAPCTEENIQATAYYINRVNDGVKQLASMVLDLRNTMNTEISNYVTTTIPARETPYTLATMLRYGSKLRCTSSKKYYTYFTMRLYVYNPGTTVANVTSTVITPVGDITDASVTYLNSDETIASTIGIFSVPCRSFITIKYVGRMANPIFGASTASVTIATNLGTGTKSVTTIP